MKQIATFPKTHKRHALRAPFLFVGCDGLNDVGRRIGGRWAVSHVALQMLLDGNKHALELYLRRDRSSEAVISYYLQLGILLPRRAVIGS
jgi:hypothetical protein